MAIGSGITLTANNAQQATAPGSVLSNWQVIHDDTTTTQAAGVVLNPASCTASQVHPATIPAGTTRVLVRGRVDDAATTFTTLPIVKLMGLDANGVPMRLDNANATAAGVTLTFNTTASNNAADGTYLYSDPVSLTATDLQGNITLYGFATTAAAITDGTTAQAVALMVKVLN